MSILTISLQPASDADTSAAITQLVLYRPAPHSSTNGLGYHPSSSGDISGLDAGHTSGMVFLPSTATLDPYPHILHGEFVQSNWGGSYTSTFSSLSNAFGDEWQAPALPPPSPNPSTTPTSGPSDHELSPPTFACTSSSLDDALGRDWLSSPLHLPCSPPSTPEWQPVLIAPSPPPPPPNTHLGLPFQTAPLCFPASGGNYPLPTVEWFSPRIEEENDNNYISHQNGGNPVRKYGLAVEEEIICQQGKCTMLSKKPKIGVKSPKCGVNRKRGEPSKIPRKFLGKFRARPEPKRPRDNNQGKRWDLEDWRRIRA